MEDWDVLQRDLKIKFYWDFVKDPISGNRDCDCLPGLLCILNIIRALWMGACMSSESRSPLPGSSTGVRKTKGSKRSLASRNSSFDHRREKQLHRTSGCLFLNGSSEKASIFTQKGNKGINQDTMIVWEVGWLLLPFIFIIV